MMRQDDTQILGGNTEMAARPKGVEKKQVHWYFTPDLLDALDKILAQNPPRNVDNRNDLVIHALWKFIDEHPAKRSR